MKRGIQHDPESSRKPITKEHLDGVDGGFLLHHVFTENECKQYIEASEEMGYESSPLTILNGNYDKSQLTDYTKQIRDSMRVLCDVPQELVRELEMRIEKFMPEQVTVDNHKWNLNVS
jgi:hypothetical protein